MARAISSPDTFGAKAYLLAAVSVLIGEIACINASGYATAGAADATLVPIGIFNDSVDNSGGSPGDLACAVLLSQVKDGPVAAYPVNNDNGDPCDQASVGHSVYVASKNSVAKTSNGGTLPRAGICHGFNADGQVMVEFDRDADAADITSLDARLTTAEGDIDALEVAVAAGMPVFKKTLTATHVTITAAAASEAVNLDTTLPANSRIVGVDMHTLTPFSGGTVGDFTVDVGTAGDVDALIDGADLFAAAVDGGPSTMPQGVRPNKTFAGGGQLLATFRCGSDTVGNATAGSVTIDVLYTVLA